MIASPRRSPLIVGALIVGLTTFVAGTHPTVSAAETTTTTTTSSFAPVEPCRLLDTRTGGNRLAGGAERTLQVTGRCGIPDSATSVAINVAAVSPDATGWFNAWPAGEQRPTASMLNYTAGDVRSNSTLVQVGSGGRIALYSLAATDLAIDVTGYFEPADGDARAGRFVPVELERLVDTRTSGRPDAGQSIRVGTDVPTDAVAVAVNLVSTETLRPDFLTAFPSGSERPETSTLNISAPGQTRAVSAIVPVAEGEFDVYSHQGSHIIVDITGYFTGSSARSSTSGLFVATVPTRLVDTRAPYGDRGGPKLWEGGGREFDVSHITGSATTAVAANWTMTDTEDVGYVVGYPAGNEVGTVSTVNADRAQQTAANSAITPTSRRGIAVHASESTDIVVDITGWFTGEPIGAPVADRPENSPPAPRRVVVISDSAFAGIRWNGTLAGLQGASFDTRLESCRRLVAPSCRGREGYRPPTAQNEIRSTTGVGPNDILVLATGYDDSSAGFASDFDAIVQTARAQGFRHIAWTTFRTNVSYGQPSGLHANYEAINATMESLVATGAYPDVRIWQFEQYAGTADSWFYSDGIHQTRLGSFGAADWISRHVAAFDDRPCPQPMQVGAAVPTPCPNPDTGPRPDIAGLYGL